MDDLHNAAAEDGSPEERFGTVLRALRQRAGLTVRQLAAALHRGHASIVQYEGGKRLAPVEVVEQYEEHFGLARGELGALRERARSERLEHPRDGTLEEHLGEVTCPYKGLHAFEYDDAALFFGREAQLQAVLARLAQVRFVAVVGASGSGKSSFVRAGLLPGLSAAPGRSVVVTPGEHPVQELARAVGAATGVDGPALAQELRDDRSALERAIRSAGHEHFAIAVDQFEELFTLCRDERERECVVDALMAAWSDPSSPVVLVVALRADFYGRVAAYPRLAQAVLAEQALIGPMSPADLRRAIELPAANSGLSLQPGLAQTIVEDLAGEPGSLPLLSHALLETWKRRRRLTLTVSGYRDAGGVRGAIAQTAERTLQGMSEADRSRARSIFLSLTDVTEGTEPARRRIDRDELAARPQASDWLDRVLGILVDARLVSVDEHTVVVAHEALIRHWPRLRGWIDADRAGLLVHRRLSGAAREWDGLTREPGALYRGSRLAAAAEWAADRADQLSPLEHDFLTASHAADERERLAGRRRTHRLRGLAAGLAVVAVAVAVLALWALDQRGDARRRADEATSLALTQAAARLLDDRPDLSLLLAMEAYRATPLPTARSSVLAALSAARTPAVLGILHGHSAAVDAVAFSPDGRLLASGGHDGTVRLWDARSHKQRLAPLVGSGGAIRGIAFSPDGRTIAVAEDSVTLWDARAGRLLGRVGPALSPGGAHDVAFSPDGRTLAAAGGDGKIRLWDARSRSSRGAPLEGNVGPVGRVAFAPDGRTLAASTGTGGIQLWDLRTGTRRATPGGRSLETVSIAFSSDGRTLTAVGAVIRRWRAGTLEPIGTPVSGDRAAFASALAPGGRVVAFGREDGTVRLHDAVNGKPLSEPLKGHTDAVGALAFSPDGRALASASADTTLRIWNARPPADALLGHRGSVEHVAVSPDGRTLASAGRDKTIRLWSMASHRQLGTSLVGHTAPVVAVAFASNGRTLTSVSEDRSVRRWDVRTHRALGAPLIADAGPSERATFSRDGGTLATVGLGGPAQVWDLRARTLLGTLRTGVIASVDGLALSPNGRVLASVGSGETRLWDPRTGKPLGAALPDNAGGYSVAFSPDGRTLATTGDHRTIHVWDVRSRKELGSPLVADVEPLGPSTRRRIDPLPGSGLPELIIGLTFSPDGRMLATGGFDQTVRLWDLRTNAHRQIGAVLHGHIAPVERVAFSPDGRSVASASSDRSIRIWNDIVWRSFAELRSQVCRLVGGSLTRREWAQRAAGISYRRSCP